jgi:integrase
MQATINNTLLSRLKPKTKPYEVRDTKLTGFILRVNLSGKMVYMCEYARGKRIMVGKACVLTPAQARDSAKEILADVVKGIDPAAAKKTQHALTLQQFLEKEYTPWVEAHRKCGGSTVNRIKIHFLAEFGHKPLAEITAFAIEKWKTKRLQAGIKPITVNRAIAALKGVLSKTLEWGLINTHPLAKLKLEKVDDIARIRYLTKDEETSLRKALDVREEKLRKAREKGNTWRRERAYEEMPDLRNQVFADYMKPMILLSLNTGLRRGELLSLTWDNINFAIAALSVAGYTSKSNKTRHVPLNREALEALQAWHKQTNGAGLVFYNKDGKQLSDVKKSWATILNLANIKGFRWHDQRHHFASRLVMAGVDLNTVRELLGHSDIKMTLRYAHLAPEHKAEAVAKLVNQ